MKVCFDQFYTKPEVAEKLYNDLDMKVDLNEFDVFIEPSAGMGVFFNLMPIEKRMGFDIDPKIDNIIKCDFLKHPILFTDRKTNIITVGNPPYGKRSKLAIDFINRSMVYSSIVAMILPVSFMKYSAQSKLNKNFGIIHDEILPKNSFIANGKQYNVNATFQIWKLNSGIENRKPRPITSHSDFDMYLYNNTSSTRKFFNYEWDFAVPRQGYQDYLRRETSKENCEMNKQWIFFKAHDKKVLDNLMKIDYCELSRKNTTIPGFGKADIIEKYEETCTKEKNNLLSYFNNRMNNDT